MESKRLHYNVPQLRSSLVDAPEEWAVLGRGTGKTEGILAPKTVRMITGMPRSSIVLIGATFQQILTRTLPPLVAGWEKLGYKHGIHYLIGTKPTEQWKKRWKWPGPYRPPFKYEYVISWFNGAVMQMVSQDRIGSTNGMSIDGVVGDEAKLLNKERLNTETLPANRGICLAFSNNPQHHGLTFTTDMPVGTSGRWILEKEKEMDKNRIDQILRLVVHRMKLEQAGADTNQLGQIDQLVNELRRGQVYYHEASTLDNIHGVGIQYIRQMIRNLSDFEFSTSILNRRPLKLEDGFYPDLDEEKHGYFAYDYHKFLNTGYKLGAMELDGAAVDADYDPLKPLHIALDNNRSITPLVVGQIVDNKEIRIIKGLHSLFPKKLYDTLEAFSNYYKHHIKKIIYFWFDHTSTAEYGHAGSQCDEVVRYLQANGWTVIERYVGQASGHERRYTMYGHLLKEDDYYPYRLRINRDRCADLLLSMYQAQAIRTKRGFGKDKKPELDKNYPAQEATHYSEALDMLVWGLLETDLSFAEEGTGEALTFQMI